MFIRPSTFAQRLDLLQRQRFAVRSLHEVLAAVRPDASLPSTWPTSVVVIAIDDGWYGVHADLLPALEARGMPATLYCDTAHLRYGQPIPHVLARALRDRHAGIESPDAQEAFRQATDLDTPLTTRTAALARYSELRGIDLQRYVESGTFTYMTPQQLCDLPARGISVELHTHHHTLHDFSPARIHEEITRNREELEAILGDGVQRVHFCFPSGMTHPEAGRILRSLGVDSATVTQPGLMRRTSDRYGLPRYLDGDHVSLIEFEAWVSGFTDTMRQLMGPWSRLLARARRRPSF